MSFTKKWKYPVGTRAYYAWRSMKARCYNEGNASFQHYGGRGIAVCDRWLHSYDSFYEDMGDPPPGMSLDRKNTDGDYTPGNCKWSTVTEQLNNQRRNVQITHSGKTMTVAEWARTIGVSYATLHRRLKRMDVGRALSAARLRGWEHGTRAGYEGHGCRCDKCRTANASRHRVRRAKLVADRLEGTER